MNPSIAALLQAMDQNSNSILVVANIILVIVTAVYVFLTWRTVGEMRKARESELEAHLVASLEPWSAQYARICIRNIGGGPALNVELTLSVLPQVAQLQRVWQHPAIWPGNSEFFLLPSQKSDDGAAPTLFRIADQYEDLVVAVKWYSLLGKLSQKTSVFNLKSQAQGWANAGNLIHVQSTEESLKKLAESVDKVEYNLRTTNRAVKDLQGSVDNMAAASRVKRITRVRCIANSRGWRSQRPLRSS